MPPAQLLNGTVPFATKKATDPTYAKLLRNIERHTQLLFNAFENEQSCSITFHLQKGRPAGIEVKTHEPPVL